MLASRLPGRAARLQAVRAATRRRYFRPIGECLERRLLLATLEWDTDFFTPGAQGATQELRWLDSNVWWNSATNSNQNWVQGSDAIFGGVPGTVNISDGETVEADDITFSVFNYLIDDPGNFDSVLKLVGGELNHNFFVNGNATIDVDIHAFEGFDKEGPFTLSIGGEEGEITADGTININAGQLFGNRGLFRAGEQTELVINFADVSGANLTIGTSNFLTVDGLSGGGSSGGEISVNSALVIDDDTNRTFAGRMTGSMALVKTGSGVQTLSNTGSNFTGGVNVSGGTLSVPNMANDSFTSPLGSSGSYVVSNAATLRYTGTTNNSTNRHVVLMGPGSAMVDVSSTGNLSLAGTISQSDGVTALVKTGVGQLNLSNSTNSFTGGVHVKAGAVLVSSVADSGTNSPLGQSGNITLGKGSNIGELIFSNNGASDSTNRPIVLASAGKINVAFANSTLTLNGVISNDDTASVVPALHKDGPGTLIINGVNTYDDPEFAATAGPDSNTFIDAGTLRLGNADVLPGNTRVDIAAAAFLDMATFGEAFGSLTGTGNVINNDTDINIGSDNTSGITYSGAISGTGQLFKNGTGTQALGGSNTYTGATMINVGTLRLNSATSIADTGDVTVMPGATLLLAANETIDGLSGGGSVSLGANTLTAGAGNASTMFSGTFVTGTGALTKTGTGTLTLSGSSSAFTGNVTINGGGAISVADVTNSSVNGPLGAGSIIVIGDAGSSGRLLFTGAAADSTNRATVLNLGGGVVEVTNAATALTLSGQITGAGKLTKDGLGTLVLANAASNFDGGVTVRGGGAVSVADVNVLGGASPLGDNGTISLGDATTSGRLIFTGAANDLTSRTHSLGAGGGTIDVTNVAAALDLTGAVNGAVSLTKLGAGVLKFSGNKDYTGATNVNAGTLVLGGHLVGSAVTVGGGTLTSTFNGAAIGPLALAGGTLSFGPTNNTHSISSGAVTLSGGTLAVNLNSAANIDKISTSGAVTFNGTIPLQLTLAYNPADNVDVLRFIANDGNQPTVLNGTSARFDFGGNILEDGEVFAVPITGGGSQFFEIRYGLTAADNDVRLNAISFDFGDAPAPILPTLLANDGARHFATGPTLGANRDAESDGQPNATATGDDVTGAPDDEDGIVFGANLVVGQTGTVTVTASAAGQLNAWIDFNNNGSWADGGEQIFSNRALTAGANLLTFGVPAAATVGVNDAARFRLNSAGGLSFTGQASDGEIEDHPVTFQLPTSDKIGIHRDNQFYQDLNGNGIWNGNAGGDRLVSFGNPGDLPLVGDWNGDGFDEIGVKRSNQYYLDANGNGAWNGPAGGDLFFTFGNGSDVPLVGDWDGDGDDQIGVQRGNQFYLDRNGNGVWNGTAGGDLLYAFGNSGDVPLAGDWDGDGDDQIGVHRGSQFYLDRNSNGVWNGAAGGDRLFNFGATGDVPIIGDWNANGTDKIGVQRGDQFYRDNNGNGTWNGTAGGDLLHTFGNPGDRPIDGKWRPVGALLAAGGAAASPSDAAPLTRDALAPILQQAIILWANTGLTSSQLHTLQSVQVVIADLPGAQLGLSLGGTILLDSDAAGYGWFVDPTPDDNSEFSDPQSLLPNPQSLDLLSAVLHELGHELGFDHDDDFAAMFETLTIGTRRLL